jgi:hypothetical protein
MQEFSSVTASSYDAESLAPLLNERAADGWEVVSIVSAGTNIVAYLSRDAEAPAETGEAPEQAEEVVEEVAVEETTTPADDSAPLWGDTNVADQEPATETPAETPAEEPAEEPAGWGAAPESTASESTGESVEDLAAQVGGEEAAAAAATTPFLGTTEPTAEPEPVAETPAAEPEPAAPAAEPAVPAGWYADPSGRFELRYWDGAAWTEHVSRAGQQFTDPPVA